MKNSLSARFAIIIITILLAAIAVYKIPPKLGIDLAGGTSLLYELDLSKMPDMKENPSELAGRVIEVLKKRVDPYGQKNIIWRVVGGKRIQIQMPRPDKETLEARDALDKAVKDLEGTRLMPSLVQAALAKKGAEREADFVDKCNAPRGSERFTLLERLGTAQDAYDAVKAEIEKMPPAQVPPELRQKKLDAQKVLNGAQDALRSSDVNMQELQGTLTAADNPKNAAAQAHLDDMIKSHPAQKAKIEAVIAAHKKLMELSGGGVDSPEELQRMVTGAGVLDFRITVNPADLGADTDAFDSLQKYGPDHQITVGSDKARWFLIDPNGVDNFGRGSYVTARWAEQPYVLCYDDNFHTLTHSDPARKPWSVKAGAAQSDPDSGGLALPFSPDPVGAAYMGDLTTNNKQKAMAILLDNKALTAPVIQSTITDHGQITFGAPSATRSIEMLKKEADDLKQIMDAGSLPATLQREPISVVDITSSMGEDNITAGKRSAYFAVAAVVAFMLVYYTITGFFADAALMMNLLLVLAAMAAFGGTFTLPGIAGLVLTLGMAVDANVLINERIREELHKGASLWMAIKQGYDRVFWTIFDANLTTSLTSIVLIEVGSEEVKGFGVTLLIGLIIHMFTALFVTRTLMMAGVRWGIIKAIDDHSVAEYLREVFTLTWLRNGHFPFMRVITVTKIDWIGKRHIFWAVSAVITIAGLVAFVARGEDKYDIEFRGGTQVTLQLKKPSGNAHELTLADVRKRIESIGLEPGLKEMGSATVYGEGKPDERRYEMQTTIANTPTDKTLVKDRLLPALADAFKDVLDVKTDLTIRNAPAANTTTAAAEKSVSQLVEEGVIVPLSENTLGRSFEKRGIEGMPDVDVQNFQGGTAIVLDNINPPQTRDQLIDRIQQARSSADMANIPHRQFDVIPLIAAVTESGTQPGIASSAPVTSTNATEKDTRPLTRAVMVSVDESQHYDANDPNSEATWMEKVAAGEWKVVLRSLQGGSSFEGVTSFDPVVAGQAKQSAIIAIVLSLLLIVIYVWVRFGGIRYGLGAILSLAHDAIVAVAGTVLSGVAYHYIFHDTPNWLLITDYKINLTMIAAYLTVIGYSVNDTIVIFDRVRELRGKSSAPLSAKLVNDAINQCFGRTIWTTFTVFIVVLIMYIWGGEGVRGFSFAMLIGVFTGAYSTLAIASPMLLATAKESEKAKGSDGGSSKVVRRNPFLPPNTDADPTGDPEVA